MTFTRIAASTSARASGSVLRAATGSSASPAARLFSSVSRKSGAVSRATSTVETACSGCQSQSILRSSSQKNALSLSRGYATATRPNSMAEVVNSPETGSPSKSAKISVDEIKPRNTEPVVVSPIKEGAVDEAVDALRENIGRPIYLDMQVCRQAVFQCQRQLHCLITLLLPSYPSGHHSS